MTDQVSQSPSAVEARSHIYGLFARSFSHPDEEFLDLVFDGQFSTAILEAGHYLPYSSPFPESMFSLVGEGYKRIDIDIFYASTFEAGQTGGSLRQSAYSRRSEAEVMESAFRFYEHFGLSFNQGELRELPDVLPVELEFMHYLTYLQSSSTHAETTSGLIQAQSDFLTRHLADWTGALVGALVERAGGRLYDELGLLLKDFLKAEQFYLQDDQ